MFAKLVVLLRVAAGPADRYRTNTISSRERTGEPFRHIRWPRGTVGSLPQVPHFAPEFR
jgi:hypothetical protein